LHFMVLVLSFAPIHLPVLPTTLVQLAISLNDTQHDKAGGWQPKSMLPQFRGNAKSVIGANQPNVATSCALRPSPPQFLPNSAACCTPSCAAARTPYTPNKPKHTPYMTSLYMTMTHPSSSSSGTEPEISVSWSGHFTRRNFT